MESIPLNVPIPDMTVSGFITIDDTLQICVCRFNGDVGLETQAGHARVEDLKLSICE
jgi:hypothetical protein